MRKPSTWRGGPTPCGLSVSVCFGFNAPGTCRLLRAGLSKERAGVDEKTSALVTDALASRLPGGRPEPKGNEITNPQHAKLRSETSPALSDSANLRAAARTEGYEIAAYETLRRMAKGLGEAKAVELLDENLKQEKEALRQVEKIATRVSNESTKEPTSA